MLSSLNDELDKNLNEIDYDKADMNWSIWVMF